MLFNKHEFTKNILSILEKNYPNQGNEIFTASSLLQYLNFKTRAADRESKTRAGLANHYAIYVLVEDYLSHEFDVKGGYENYEGAQFSYLLYRQRELPFGIKMQNHALNHRLNEEFRKYFSDEGTLPIIRDVETNRYWINKNLLIVNIGNERYNIAVAVNEIIYAYVKMRMESFDLFMDECKKLLKISDNDFDSAIKFIRNLLRPNVDARIFEIVSYSVLKQHYSGKNIYWGWAPDDLNEDFLALYKTVRTNANDGGIDFVMKPLGRFFQVTETVDSGKYFLDIDKVQRYPVTFVVKTEKTQETLQKRSKQQAEKKYKIKKVVDRYLACIEEIINVPMLMEFFDEITENGNVWAVVEEIMLQSRIEFNIEDENTELSAFNRVE